MDLLRQRHALPHDRLEDPYVLEHVCLAQVEEVSRESRCRVETVVHEEHQQPIPDRELEWTTRPDLPLPLLSREPLLLERGIRFFDLLEDRIELVHLETGERPEHGRRLRQPSVAQHLWVGQDR